MPQDFRELHDRNVQQLNEKRQLPEDRKRQQPTGELAGVFRRSFIAALGVMAAIAVVQLFILMVLGFLGLTFFGLTP